MTRDLDVHDAADPIGRLAAFRPPAATLDPEWGPATRDAVRTSILADPDRRSARLRFAPRRRTRVALAPLAAAAAVVALIGGIVAYAVTGSTGGDAAPPAGPVYSAPSYRDTPVVGAGHYSHRTVTAYRVTPGRDPVASGTMQDWVAPDGSVWSKRTGDPAGAECYHFPSSRPASFDSPDRAFFDALPTDPPALLSYLRSHVDGSTSRDEAVFVAVGDLLRTADGLASSRLRSALVGVLSRNSRVTVHPDVTDFRGRASVRADFVDAKNRPGELDSLYFDASTFQLLEERSGSTPGPTPPYASTSYDATADPATTSTELTGKASISVMDAETVVDAVPADVVGCPSG